MNRLYCLFSNTMGDGTPNNTPLNFLQIDDDVTDSRILDAYSCSMEFSASGI
jgi:hypothetical protein